MTSEAIKIKLDYEGDIKDIDLQKKFFWIKKILFTSISKRRKYIILF